MARSRWCKKIILSLLCPVLLPLLSCASTGSFAEIDNDLINSRFTGGIVRLENKKSTLYKSKDILLYNLDLGMLNHYAHFYTESIFMLQEAERAIEDAFTKSISQELSTYLLNDNTRDYSGEDYEDIYINAFNALNYYHLGKNEGAMVEIRRMNNKLHYLADKYDVELTNLQKKAIEESQNHLPPNLNAPAHFSDSALARYLGMLFYRAEGLYDDVRIDRDYLLAAFANAPAIYRHKVPMSISDEMEIPEGLARLNVIAFGGLSPIKKETIVRIPLPDNHWIKIAYPEMESRISEIQKIQLVMDNGDIFQLELLEDIDAVARETFKTKQQIIYLKTVIRAVMKSVSSVALNAAAQDKDGEGSLLLGILGFASQLMAEASEQADIRISRYFPARAYVGGINLLPGIYSFNVNYYNIFGQEIASIRHEDFQIKGNALNLAQAVCLK